MQLINVEIYIYIHKLADVPEYESNAESSHYAFFLP